MRQVAGSTPNPNTNFESKMLGFELQVQGKDPTGTNARQISKSISKC